MRIDRIEFLELTLLLSLASCDRPAVVAAPEPVVIPLQPPPVASVEARPPASSAAPPAPIAGDDDACSNAKGSLALCSQVSPTCEGLADECRSLGTDFRPRVAERFGACFTKAKRPRCRDKSLGACMRKAIESACVEPFAEAKCRDFIARCTAAKKPAKYTFEQCTKVVSSVHGGPGGSGWDNGNLDLLGPSSESHSCTLEYVLPYQPWGASWR